MEPLEIEGLIDEIVGQVQEWEKDTLVEFVQDQLRGQLRGLHPEKLQSAYEDFVEYHPELASSPYTKATLGPGGSVAWFVDFGPVDGPVLGPYSTRKEALKAEAEWLNV